MASKGINKVILVGNLGQNPEIRTFQNGDSVANLSIATSETWKDKNTGEQREKTEWHRVTLHKRLAEIAGQYLNKGSKVYIEGCLQTRKWQDKAGNERYTTEVNANVMQMLESKVSSSSIAPTSVVNEPIVNRPDVTFTENVDKNPFGNSNDEFTDSGVVKKPQNVKQDDDWDDIPF